MSSVLRRLRTSRRVTLRDLSRRIDVSPTFLSFVERGANRLTLQRALQVRVALNLTDEEFRAMLDDSTRLSDVTADMLDNQPEFRALVEMVRTLPAAKLRALVRKAKEWASE